MKIVPKHVQINISTLNTAFKETLTPVQKLGIKTNFRYEQKNKTKNYTHIHNTNTWKQTWNIIEQAVTQKLHNEMKTVHEKQQKRYKTCAIQRQNTQYANIRITLG